jgi:hypothetical protein
VVGRKLALGLSQLLYLGIGLALLAVGPGLAASDGLPGAVLPVGLGVVAIAALTSARLAPCALARLRCLVARRWPHAPWLREMGAHLARLTRSGGLRPATLLLLAAWLVESLESFALLSVLGSRAAFAQVISVEGTVSLLRVLAFALPGRLGVQELGYLAAFGRLGLADAVSLTAAFALLKRAREALSIGVGYALLARLQALPAVEAL